MEEAIAKRTVAVPLDDAVPAMLVSLRPPGGNARGNQASPVHVRGHCASFRAKSFRPG